MKESEFAKPLAVITTFTTAGGFIGMDIALWPAAEDWSHLFTFLLGGFLAGAVVGGVLAAVIRYVENRSLARQI